MTPTQMTDILGVEVETWDSSLINGEIKIQLFAGMKGQRREPTVHFLKHNVCIVIHLTN